MDSETLPFFCISSQFTKERRVVLTSNASWHIRKDSKAQTRYIWCRKQICFKPWEKTAGIIHNADAMSTKKGCLRKYFLWLYSDALAAGEILTRCIMVAMLLQQLYLDLFSPYFTPQLGGRSTFCHSFFFCLFLLVSSSPFVGLVREFWFCHQEQWLFPQCQLNRIKLI